MQSEWERERNVMTIYDTYHLYSLTNSSYHKMVFLVYII